MKWRFSLAPGSNEQHAAAQQTPPVHHEDVHISHKVRSLYLAHGRSYQVIIKKCGSLCSENVTTLAATVGLPYLNILFTIYYLSLLALFIYLKL